MQNRSDDILASLRNNLKKIIQLYETQKEENKILKQKNEELKMKVNQLQLTKNDIQTDQNNTLLIKAFAEASGSNHDAKIKVNRMVREIDKCIALLNK